MQKPLSELTKLHIPDLYLCNNKYTGQHVKSHALFFCCLDYCFYMTIRSLWMECVAEQVGLSSLVKTLHWFSPSWRPIYCKAIHTCGYLFSHSLALPHLYMSRVMRKPAFCICEDADQLCGNRAADQHLFFCYIHSTIPLLSISEISSF